MLEELKCYLQEPLTNWRVNNAMEWWSDHEVKFPHVALMAQKYLAIPASSAPSERVFSQLKLIVERKRWRMDGGWVERSVMRLSLLRETPPPLGRSRGFDTI